MRSRPILLTVVVFLVIACNAKKSIVNHKAVEDPISLENGFVSPPASIQTSTYWYWMSDNISKEGVIKDLRAMKKVGINRAFIGNIGYETTPYGKVKLFSDEWWDILHTALKTAAALDIEIGIFNSPGWSQSGGPWIKPSQSMRYLTSAETRVKGPAQLNVKLNKPAGDFQDVKVIAFKAPKAYGTDILSYHPKITTSVPVKDSKLATDQHLETAVFFPGTAFNITFETTKDFTARSIVIYPGKGESRTTAAFQVKEKGKYKTLKSFYINRTNDNLNVGFKPYGPVAVAIPATTGKDFRLVFTDGSSTVSVAEIEISTAPVVDSYIEKTLAKMFQTPLPYWNEYQWAAQAAINDKQTVIDPDGVIDISSKMDADGTLKWSVPAGDWIVQRTGMLPTGVQNGPASSEGTGLEVDKMSKAHVKSHFEAFLAEIIKRIPAADRSTWKVVVEDSYETGGQNWTDDMLLKFKDRYHYDALAYLPVLEGKVVGSQDQSDRFLWDLRRLVADRVAYDYVGGLRDISHQYGLTTWLENYGHWGFPGEFLQYGGQSDEIGGEFWSEGELGNIENRAASSAAHIYGKTKVSAESFTAGGKAYARYPYVMKQRGDRFFTEGINNTLLHVFIEQPDDEKVPGINANFGNEFNRHNTWFNYLDLFTSYLKRCNYMLQQGRYVADVAYFIGEDAPKMTGITNPELPAGYSFDYINAEVILTRLKVEHGRMVLPDGMSYRLLVLPELKTMRPELLGKITELVSQGATILGPAPQRSPSLENYPAADIAVQKLAKTLWGGVNGTSLKLDVYGKGKVLNGMDMHTALNTLGIKPDFKLDNNEQVLFIHRKSTSGDIYFISNQSEKTVSINPEFRIAGMQPEMWDPVTGEIRQLPSFSQQDGATTVPLQLAPLQSLFVVFKDVATQPKKKDAINFPSPRLITTITAPWKVDFQDKKRGPKEAVMFNELADWTSRPEEAIRYYSGTALYSNTFKAKEPKTGERIYLNLGEITGMAKVRVNGTAAGGVWTAPWRVDITNAVKGGVNTIEIAVVNNWVNRLIGDSTLPAAQRTTWTSTPLYNEKSKLQPSGLTGPVTISVIGF
jgi:hypothetical protein